MLAGYVSSSLLWSAARVGKHNYLRYIPSTTATLVATRSLRPTTFPRNICTWPFCRILVNSPRPLRDNADPLGISYRALCVVVGVWKSCPGSRARVHRIVRHDQPLKRCKSCAGMCLLRAKTGLFMLYAARQNGGVMRRRQGQIIARDRSFPSFSQSNIHVHACMRRHQRTTRREFMANARRVRLAVPPL